MQRVAVGVAVRSTVSTRLRRVELVVETGEGSSSVTEIAGSRLHHRAILEPDDREPERRVDEAAPSAVLGHRGKKTSGST